MSELVDKSVVAAWDTVSSAYQERYRISPHEVHLGPMVPSPTALGLDLDVAGRNVLDFGCGGGQNAVACALAGAAHVIGVDPSERQLDLARALAQHEGAEVEFRPLSDEGIADLPDDLDLVLSIYSMQFVAEVAPVFRSLCSRMRPGGLLVISVDHPLRVSGEWRGDEFILEDYYARGWQQWPYDFPEAGIRVEMRRFRRTIEEWVSALLASPFVLRGLYEPLPMATPDSFGRKSKYGTDDPRNVFTTARLEKVPGSLILVAQRKT